MSGRPAAGRRSLRGSLRRQARSTSSRRGDRGGSPSGAIKRNGVWSVLPVRRRCDSRSESRQPHRVWHSRSRRLSHPRSCTNRDDNDGVSPRCGPEFVVESSSEVITPCRVFWIRCNDGTITPSLVRETFDASLNGESQGARPQRDRAGPGSQLLLESFSCTRSVE